MPLLDLGQALHPSQPNYREEAAYRPPLLAGLMLGASFLFGDGIISPTIRRSRLPLRSRKIGIRFGRILVAQGRDAADVPLTLIFGPGTLSSLDGRSLGRDGSCDRLK